MDDVHGENVLLRGWGVSVTEAGQRIVSRGFGEAEDARTRTRRDGRFASQARRALAERRQAGLSSEVVE